MKTASGQEWTTLESINCVICDRDDSELLFSAHDFIYGNEGTFRIVQCCKCGLVYVNPRPPKEESPKFYPTTYFSFQPPWVPKLKAGIYAHVRRTLKAIVLEEGFSYPRLSDSIPSILSHSLVRRSLTRIFTPYVQSNKVPPFIGNHRILDVGCGNGAFLLEMKNLGWDAYGVELNPTIGNYARTRLKLNVSAGRLEDTDFPDAFFDVVTFWDTLEHLPNPLEVLTETFRILSPTGLLIIDTPNFDCVPRRLFREKWFNVAAPLHYYLYTRETLNRLLGKAGFYIDKVRYPLGTAGLRESLEIVLLGRIKHNGSTARRILRNIFYVPHRLIPRGHLVAYAKRKSPQAKAG